MAPARLTIEVRSNRMSDFRSSVCLQTGQQGVGESGSATQLEVAEWQKDFLARRASWMRRPQHGPRGIPF